MLPPFFAVDRQKLPSLMTFSFGHSVRTFSSDTRQVLKLVGRNARVWWRSWAD